MDKAVPIPYIESTEPRSTSCGASLFVPTANHHTKSCIVRRENQLLTERQKVLCNHSLYNLVEMFISPFAGDNRPSELFLDITDYDVLLSNWHGSVLESQSCGWIITGGKLLVDRNSIVGAQNQK